MRRNLLGVFVLALFSLPAFGQISCGFVVDLSAPQIDSLYPAPGDTVSPDVAFGVVAHDDGAGIWTNYSDSRAQWDTAGCDAPVATYLTWAVNDFSPSNFMDTLWGVLENPAGAFNPGDSVRVCAHIIDSIQNLGCSCCPNDTDTCWTFYIFACDTFYAYNECPNPCGIVTSCSTQTVTFLIDTVNAINGPDTNIIGVQVYVNGILMGSGTIADQPWAEYHGNPDDGIYPDTIVINPPGGVWNHGDSVMVIVGTDSCPVVMADTCQFTVDLIPPVLTTFSPADGETLTSAVVNITGSIYDDFIGVAPGSTSIRITVYDSTGVLTMDTLYTGYGDNFTLTGTFNSGDSITVCVHTADNVDIQPGCTCPPNVSDSCWWFTVLISEPYAWVVIPVDSNGNGEIVSSCSDATDSTCGNQQIILRTYDSHGMTDTGIVLYVNGVRYDETSPAISTAILGGDTLQITFDPAAIGTCWADGEWVHFRLDSALNTLGFNLVSPVEDSFVVDLSPPVFVNTIPADSSVFHTDSVFVSVSVLDSICGDALITAVRASGTVWGAAVDTTFPVDSTDSFGINLTGLSNGDSVTICAYAADTCADYCGPNTDSTCWTFYIVIGTVGATVLAPVDTNGDGAVISSCEDQGFIWHLDYDDAIGLDWSRIWVTIDGISYNWSDAHLDTINGHTLFFNPDPDIAWEDGDTIIFCLDSLVDLSGATLDSSVCGWVLIDLSPPVLVASNPANGDTIYTHDITVQASFYDSVCTDTLTSVDSVWAEQWNGGTLLNSFTPDSFPFDLTGLGDGDSVAVCAVVSDHCMDYCEPNVDTICWYFSVSMGEPWGEFIAPPDTNMDGIRITTCADGGFILYAHDSHGMDTTYFHFTVDTNRTGAMDYHYGDPGVSVGYVGDSTTMAIYFNPGWTLSSGTWVYVVLDTAVNLLPVPDTIVSPVVDSFLIDTEPPTFTYTGPTGSISDVSATISVSASDDICGSAVSYDSLVITSSVSGIDWHITSGVWDTTITGLLSGDEVQICAYAHDICSDTCGPNYGDTCWNFTVSTGVSVNLVEPVDLNGDGDTISACADQPIVWTVSSIAEVDSASITATVCGTEYHWGDPELSASGDSIIWTPPAGFWTDGMTCDFSLAVCDVGGVCDTAYGQVVIDLAPPVFSGEFPADGSTILTDNTDIYISASDSICGDAVPEFIHITSSVSGIDTTINDTLGAHIGGFVDGDIITVCVGAHDNCADYCGPNADTTCWTFNVALGAVRAVVDEPRDVNGDACVQTACPCQPIQWTIYSQHGVDTTTFEAVIDGITYGWGPEFSLTSVDDTTFILVFNPSVAGTCWNDNGYTVNYAITYLADTLGTDSLSADVGGSFTVLLAPPEISLVPLPPDSAFCESTLTFTTSMDDSVACTFDGTVSVHLFGTSGDSTFTLPFGDASIPVLSGDTICVSISAYNTADYGTTCAFTDTIYNWTAGLDTCYVIQCECNIAAFAGPDQHSCPGAPVVLGCEPVYSGAGITSHGVIWYNSDSSWTSTEENPTVSPESTTTYIVAVYGICVAGDTVWAYDTVTVYIDFQPTPPPTIVSPASGTELTAGDYTLVWNSIDSTMATQPVYYQVILNGAVVADSLTDTTYDFSITCEETLTFMVVAFNECYYELNDSCNPADSVSGYTSATYETSAVVTVWGEPCGGPVAEAVYPPNHTITSCDDQILRFLVYDSQGVPLVVESLRVALNGTEYDTSETFITYTAISADSGTVEVSPPSGSWDDNDTITVAITQLYNEFGRSLDTVVSITIYTDFTPPQATMLSPTPDSAVAERSPMVDINITDNVAGVAPESLIVIITTDVVNETLAYPNGMMWDDATGGLLIDFNALGISLADGETAYVQVHTCDSIDSEFCGSNCDDYSWMFWYPYTVGCDRRPNPFTPNLDGKNEYAQFTFPDMGQKAGTIYIYNVHDVLVKQIEVEGGISPIQAMEQARWDGTDMHGEQVPQGVYLYVIMVDGEVVCEGTVTVAR